MSIMLRNSTIGIVSWHIHCIYFNPKIFIKKKNQIVNKCKNPTLNPKPCLKALLQNGNFVFSIFTCNLVFIFFFLAFLFFYCWQLFEKSFSAINHYQHRYPTNKKVKKLKKKSNESTSKAIA